MYIYIVCLIEIHHGTCACYEALRKDSLAQSVIIFVPKVWAGRLNKGILAELTRLCGGTVRLSDDYSHKRSQEWKLSQAILKCCLFLWFAWNWVPRNSTEGKQVAEVIQFLEYSLGYSIVVSQVLMLLFWCRGQWCGDSMSMIQSMLVSCWLTN